MAEIELDASSGAPPGKEKAALPRIGPANGGLVFIGGFAFTKNPTIGWILLDGCNFTKVSDLPLVVLKIINRIASKQSWVAEDLKQALQSAIKRIDGLSSDHCQSYSLPASVWSGPPKKTALSFLPVEDPPGQVQLRVEMFERIFSRMMPEQFGIVAVIQHGKVTKRQSPFDNWIWEASEVMNSTSMHYAATGFKTPMELVDYLIDNYKWD